MDRRTNLRADSLAVAITAGDLSGLGALFNTEGTPCPTVSINPGQEEILDPRLDTLFTYWQELPRIGDLPDQTGIDPIALAPVLPIVMLLDVLESGDDFQYLIYGEEIAERLGQNLLGKRTSEVPTAPHIAVFFIALYRIAISTKKPILSEHMPPPSVSVSSWRRLILPLVDENASVSRLIVGNAPGSWRRPLEQ